MAAVDAAGITLGVYIWQLSDYSVNGPALWAGWNCCINVVVADSLPCSMLQSSMLRPMGAPPPWF
jgi:hypothetical protein